MPGGLETGPKGRMTDKRILSMSPSDLPSPSIHPDEFRRFIRAFDRVERRIDERANGQPMEPELPLQAPTGKLSRYLPNE